MTSSRLPETRVKREPTGGDLAQEKRHAELPLGSSCCPFGDRTSSIVRTDGGELGSIVPPPAVLSEAMCAQRSPHCFARVFGQELKKPGTLKSVIKSADTSSTAPHLAPGRLPSTVRHSSDINFSLPPSDTRPI